MKRRDFIKYSACGLTALAVGTRLNLPPFFNTHAHAATVSVDLGMMAADVEMIDLKSFRHWLFTVGGEPTFPGPVIFFIDNGDTLQINVTNNLVEPDGVARTREVVIVGTAFTTGSIVKGDTGILTIPPSGLAPGTYLYKDATLDPLSRVLGLHGCLVVLPAEAITPISPGPGTKTTPYGIFPGTKLQQLFNDLGAWGGDPLDPNALFPGKPWFATTDANQPTYNNNVAGTNPEGESDRHHFRDFREDGDGPQSEVFERFLYRTRIWLHSSIDPMINNLVANTTDPLDPLENINWINRVRDAVPQYFTINGRSGAFGSHATDVMPISTIGEPHLIRLLNAGMATHSPHIHANHVFVIAVNNVVGNSGDAYFGAGADNLMFVDTMTLMPEDRVDWLLPYIRPPDIPKLLENGLLLPLDQLIPEELNTVLIDPQNPLAYPMHSHMELDQTAAGGNYPQGTVATWEIEGEFGAEFHPDEVPSANRPRGRGRGRGRGQG